MVTLKETERVEVLEFDNIFYTCLVDSNEGLITYEYMPYLSKKDGVITFNFEKFTEDTKYIVDYQKPPWKRNIRRWHIGKNGKD